MDRAEDRWRASALVDYINNCLGGEPSRFPFHNFRSDCVFDHTNFRLTGVVSPGFNSLKWVSGTLSTERPGSGPYHLEDHSGRDWAFYCDPEIVRYNNCISRDPAPSSSSQSSYRVGFFDHTHLYNKRRVLMFVQHGQWLLLPYSRQSLNLGERLEENHDSAALYILIRLGAAAFLIVPTLIALWQKTG